MAVYGGIMQVDGDEQDPHCTPLVIPKAAGSCFITGKVDGGGDWLALNAAFGPLITPS